MNAKDIFILGTKLSRYSREELLQFIKEAVLSKRKVTILSGNVYSYNLAYKNIWFQRYFNQADIVRLDGSGVRLGAKILGYDTPERMTWADFAWDLAAYLQANQISIYFLGGKPGVAEKAAQNLLEKFPGLIHLGSEHGYFDKQTESSQNINIIQTINQKKPDVLVVGLGMPVQEKWLIENRNSLEVAVVMTGGAVFDYISGELKRGPKWMTDHGLEWLARMLIEPKRLWKRYIIGNPKFIYRVLLQRFGLLRLPQ